MKKSIPASQITGQIAVTVHDHPVQVTIINKTREGNETYYDMEIAPVQDSDSTTYVFPVNQSECRKSEDQGKIRCRYTSGIFCKIRTIRHIRFP